MRDTLPKSGPQRIESAIVNLDSIRGSGTHWVAYKKRGRVVEYYDSYGDLAPPRELLQYFNGRLKPPSTIKIKYNYERHQDYNTVWCGHLCLKFLSAEDR